MGALSVYHVEAAVRCDGDRETALVGVCATGKTEAAAIVEARLLDDGYESVLPHTITRVAGQGVWSPGTTLRYS